MRIAIELANGKGYGHLHREGCKDLRDGERLGEAANAAEANRLAEDLTAWDQDQYHLAPCVKFDQPERNPKMNVNKEFAIQGGQILVVAINDDGVILRIQDAKRHNRGIAKLDAGQAAGLAELLGGAPVPAPAAEAEAPAAEAEAPAPAVDADAPRCPKGKAVFKAIAPNGQAFYRASGRNYSHAVAVSRDGDDWSVWSFNGSAALAQKQADGFAGGRWGQAIARVVPAEVVADRRPSSGDK